MIHDAAAVIAAGGSSVRFGKGNKLTESLCGIPVIMRTVEVFLKWLPRELIFISANRDFRDELKELLRDAVPEENLIPGGATRTESVLNALRAVPEHCNAVAVHDAARPCVDPDTVKACYEAYGEYGAAAAAARVVDTLKTLDSDGFLSAGPDRDRIVSIETPQIFRRADLLFALESAERDSRIFTDDAAAVEAYCGIRVRPVFHRGCNIKITRREDLSVAESVIISQKVF